MKSLFRAGLAGICLMLPAASFASTIDFEVTGSGYSVMFDPQGNGPSELPLAYTYRSYDCRIGSKPVFVVFTPPKTNPNPPVIHNTPPSNPEPPIVTPPIVTPPDGNPTCPAAVPLPPSSQMAGVGVVLAAIGAWVRSRRVARA
jgi:hypothetical protein